MKWPVCPSIQVSNHVRHQSHHHTDVDTPAEHCGLVIASVGLTTPAPHSVGSSDQCQGRRLTNRVLRSINLLERLKRPEGKPLEFKPDLPSPDGALKPIVAFPNTAGDILRIGVDDRSRNMRGVADPLDEEERLAHQGFDLKLGLPSQWASMVSCW